MYKIEENLTPSYALAEYDVIGCISIPNVKSCKKLLLIGDQASYLSENMADLDYHIIAFKNAPNALNWLNQSANQPDSLPDAILCDLNLLKADRYKLFGELQKNEFLKIVPFVIISNGHTSQDKIKALEMGVDDFYSLPFNAQDLLRRITFLKQFKNEKKELYMSNEKAFEKKVSFFKRVFDIVFALISIILLSPVFLLVILAIKIENRGPIFYTSKRVGTGYKIFNFYKFRSMVQNADQNLKDLTHLNQYKDKDKTALFDDVAFVKIDNDPRITPLGNILRKTSLDELPQLFNVLKGDMSIVGNRPLPLYEAEMLTKDVWAKRFLAPAGITGLWQVTKRGKTDMSAEERINLDIDYANNASLWYDFKIILKTFPSLLQKETV